MKKFIALCKSYLSEKWSALISVFTNGTEKPQGPFLEPLNDDGHVEPDPIPEPAEKLPYVYFDSPREQVKHTIHYRSPYLGLDRAIPFRPRKERGKPFDNVRGIQVTDNLVLLRSILFTSNFPGDIREMAKQYEGRFPTEAEIEQIYAKFNEINQNLYECGEPLLQRWKYLYNSGDAKADLAMNYCLNFANGKKTYADCDSEICAVLVETSVPASPKCKTKTKSQPKTPAEKTEVSPQKPASKVKTSPKKQSPKIRISNEFDLLCLVGNQKVRLPFEKRGMGTPIGIFPFKHKPEYLELDEVENKKHTDKDVDESRLLDENFCCARVSKVVDRLNAYLKVLNKPLLEGSYLADSSYMKGCGWIIGFDNTGDYHGGNVPAKLRYMGRFYGKCKA